MAGRIGKLLALSLAEMLLLAQAALGLLLTRALLAAAGYNPAGRVLDRLARVPLVPALRGGDAARAHATARLVYAAGARFPLRATCLPKALVLRSLLKRQHLEGEFRIGVRIVDGRLEGHAWVEHAGVPLAQEPGVGERFRPLEGDVAGVSGWVG